MLTELKSFESTALKSPQSPFNYKKKKKILKIAAVAVITIFDCKEIQTNLTTPFGMSFHVDASIFVPSYRNT